MLQVSLEEELFGGQLDWEHIGLRYLQPVVALVSVDQVEVKVVGNAVSAHRVVAKAEAGLIA